jgi:hypothetical protein
MDLSKLPPAMIAQLTGAVEDYILSSRKKYLGGAVPLAVEQLAVMQPFFPVEALSNCRILVLRGQQIQDPSFYGIARMMGIRNLPSFADTAAVTFVDVIVSHEEFTDDLLFHELVHVVQYAKLGAKEFSSRYVNGFLTGGSYEEIPLEKNAYELESRFGKKKSEVFSVVEEVQSWIEAGKF